MTHMLIGGVEATIDLHAIPHEDKIAYAWGFMQGLGGEKRAKPEDRHGLADGYKKGFDHGRRVRGINRKGGKLPLPEEAPTWAKINWKSVTP